MASAQPSSRGAGAGGPKEIPAVLEPLLRALSGEPGIAVAEGWGKGNAVLKFQSKLFVLAIGDQLVFKLPRVRVDELVEGSGGQRFEPRRDGKLMKEWVVVEAKPTRRCMSLARESYRFVADQSVVSKGSVLTPKRATRRPQPGLARRIDIDAPRQAVFDAVGTLKGLRGWWTTSVSGSPEVGGTIRFDFKGINEHILMRVEESVRPSKVVWACLEHTDLPEWSGTRVSFRLTERAGRCQLSFRHAGLTSALECFDDCKMGWEHFLSSLEEYVTTGEGSPWK